MGILNKHKIIEKNATLLLILSFFVISIGGLVQIVPLFWIDSTIEEVDGMRPYTPLELAGRDIYLREGCSVCHSQMIRPLRDEAERYGHYSLAAESMYDHPFQWGSKRTGPDLARVGGRYSNAWHVEHLVNPQALVPESIMPKYAFLLENELDYSLLKQNVKTHKLVGVPYSDEMVDNVEPDLFAQLDPEGDTEGLNERYGDKVNVSNFDGTDKLTEMDALVAYLQMLGTLVDFSTYEANVNR